MDRVALAPAPSGDPYRLLAADSRGRGLAVASLHRSVAVYGVDSQGRRLTGPVVYETPEGATIWAVACAGAWVGREC